MSETPRILAFAGSARKDSFNKKLVAIAAAGAREAGAHVTLIDLAVFPLPLMDQDLEEQIGVPENARKLKDLFAAHHGLLISAPEYNSSITPLLKNTIDWVSRPEPPDVTMLHYISGKTAALISASPGPMGGKRGLAIVRSLLINISVTVLPQSLSIARAAQEFTETGDLIDENKHALAKAVGAALAEKLITLLG
jgi:NAD(P)H-dependent FMN reductase